MDHETPYPHRKFLEENNIAISGLPDMLQKRIHGFEELEEDFSHLVGEDKEAMSLKLQTLSHEIDEDLEEHFDEHLENNLMEDENHKIPETTQAPQPEVKEQEPPAIPDKNVDPVKPQPKVLEAEKVQELKRPEKEQKKSDPMINEKILETFLSKNQNKVSHEELLHKGFKGEVHPKEMLVGKFQLRRGKYETAYTIHITED